MTDRISASYKRAAQSARYIVSGHDIERWLLKTAQALVASKNLARGRVPLSGAFASDVQVLDMLDNPMHRPDCAGLYCFMKAGDSTENHNRFRIQPMTNEKDEIAGLAVDIMGLSFVLILEPPDLSKPQFNGAKYRPGGICTTHLQLTGYL